MPGWLFRRHSIRHSIMYPPNVNVLRFTVRANDISSQGPRIGRFSRNRREIFPIYWRTGNSVSISSLLSARTPGNFSRQE